MKIWSKVHIKDKNRDVDTLSRALTNYLYTYGPIIDISKKYNISSSEKNMIDNYTLDRIAGLLMLFLSKDYKRINDIANKYNLDNNLNMIVNPEIEAYIEK